MLADISLLRYCERAAITDRDARGLRCRCDCSRPSVRDLRAAGRYARPASRALRAKSANTGRGLQPHDQRDMQRRARTARDTHVLAAQAVLRGGDVGAKKMSQQPLKLSDAAMEHLRNFATPIPPWRRSEYLQLVSSALQGVPDPGDAQVYRACRSVQQRILYADRRCDGPTFDGRTGMPIMSPRERFMREAASNPKFKSTNGDVGVVICGARPPR
jgi:hypothetical protein